MLNKKQLFTLILIAFFNTKIQSQIPTLNPFFFGKNAQVSNVTPINLTSIGKYYADRNWNAGNVFLKNGDSLIAYYMKYDLVRNQLEIILDTKIKAINGSFIDHFEWFSISRLQPEVYVNKQSTGLDKVTDISGFPELMEDGLVKLYKCKQVFAPREATSPTLINDTDQTIQVLEKYYLVKSDDFFEVVNGKRKNLDFLNSSKVEDYVKEENLKFNNENDLQRIVQYANGE